ncbi:hypothetical protein ACIBG5_18680 [Kribbella sp. NPDC050241]|uniref:hypothetical protein n=1 Tax=Kribbella sp. NPDC050241 TaxID=3364115 RepID=UPI0037AFD815
MLDHGWFLQKNWSGAWNHGTDESIAQFGVGCTLGRGDLKKLAVNRLTSTITTSIDAQGSTNEQSTSYAQFNYSLWGRAVDVLQRCGVDPGTTIKARRLELAKWLALGTNSLGRARVSYATSWQGSRMLINLTVTRSRPRSRSLRMGPWSGSSERQAGCEVLAPTGCQPSGGSSPTRPSMDSRMRSA